MATITINIADADLARVVAAIGGVFGYQAQLTDGLGNKTPNPETPAQFARRMVVNDIKSWVITWESQQAGANAAATANANAQTIGVT